MEEKMKLTNEQMKKLFVNMVRVRKLDELMVKLLETGKVGTFWHSAQGQEAIGVGACTFLREGDYIYGSHRGHGITKVLPKGISVRELIAEHYCRTTGLCCGISGHHPIKMELRAMGLSALLGMDFGMATGTAIVAKMDGKGDVVLCFQGDGTFARGTFHECMIMAASWKLPIIYVCEANQLSMTSPTSDIFPMKNVADLAFGYQVPGVVVDGQDVIAVYEAVQTAIDRARAGEGPSLIECKTFRYRSHAEGIPNISGVKVRTKEEIDALKERDPIKLFKEKLLGKGILSQAEVEEIDNKAKEEMEEADRLAFADPPIDNLAILERALYAE
jgi:pyruvate dehydrogenase E1 component alpha subunit